jgi:hypothetical protein
VFIAGAVAAPMLIAGAVNSPHLLQDHITPKADNDLYTGLTNDHQRYSYAVNLEHADGTENYFLLEKDGIFRIYMMMPADNTRLILVEDQERAQAVAHETVALLKANMEKINSANLNPVQTIRSDFSTCGYVSLPFEYSGGIERYKDGCPLQEIAGHEASAIYAENIALWEEAAETLAQEGSDYGPQPRDMIELSNNSPSQHYIAETGKDGLSMSLALLLGAAGLAGLETRKKRRKSRKNNKRSPG